MDPENTIKGLNETAQNIPDCSCPSYQTYPEYLMNINSTIL